MNKQISIILVILLVVAGIYWYFTGFNNSGLSNQEENGSIQTNTSQNISANGPVGVATGASGSYLVDKNGLTLYVSLKDENPAGKISQTCNAQCEKTWLPYLLEENGVAITSTTDPLLSKINLFTRADGREQYTIGTQPLYRYASDLKAGNTKGDAVDDWKVATP